MTKRPKAADTTILGMSTLTPKQLVEWVETAPNQHDKEQRARLFVRHGVRLAAAADVWLAEHFRQ